MELLETFFRRYEQRAALMTRMMVRLQLAPDAVARELLGTRLRNIASRCQACRYTAECVRWLDAGSPSDYHAFCPNATVFDTLRRAS